MRWFTSDLHLFHNLAFQLYRKDLGSIESMHYDMIVKWNKKVRPKDTVYIIGDVSFGEWEETREIISKLNGRKILVRGNHDERFTSAQWIELGFQDVRDVVVVKKGTEHGKPADKWILSHYPYSSPIRYFFYRAFRKVLKRRSEAAYYKLYLSYKGHKLLHGHHHIGPQYKFEQLNVAWDVNRNLLNENEVAEIFAKNELKGVKRFINMLKLVLW